MESRIKNSYQTYTYNFLRFDILVTCPKCSKKAIVKSDDFSFRKEIDESQIKVTCSKCGFNKRLAETPVPIIHSTRWKTIRARYFPIGGAIDPFFHLPLWFQKNYLGNLLWAYNHEHIDFLISHVEAKLRERNRPNFANKSLGSRLPRWMTSKKHRETILKELLALKSKKDSE